MSQATLFGPATPASPPALAALDRAVLRVYLKTTTPTWRETGACIDHLCARGRFAIVSGLESGDVTVSWGAGPTAYHTATAPSVHAAVAQLVRGLIGEDRR